MARDMKLQLSDRSVDDSKPAFAPWAEEDKRRQERREAIERLRGIGWDGDLEAMRLGLSDHSAK